MGAGRLKGMNASPPLLTRRLHAGDLDGLLALGLNNLIQSLLIISLCR